MNYQEQLIRLSEQARILKNLNKKENSSVFTLKDIVRAMEDGFLDDGFIEIEGE